MATIPNFDKPFSFFALDPTYTTSTRDRFCFADLVANGIAGIDHGLSSPDQLLFRSKDIS
jgi:hypothetical protein